MIKEEPIKKVAIMDLGSNSVRMDVIEICADRTYTYLRRVRELVKLSEGMGEDMRLQPEAMERTTAVISDYMKLAEQDGAEEVIAVATAAVRKASNGEDFCRMVQDRCSLALEGISGEREAEYVFDGVMGGLELSDCVIVDTGGGSTELILVSGCEALARVSLPFGAVSLSEQFCVYGETEQSLREARSFLGSQLDKISWLDEAQELPVVGVGGSICTLGVVDASLTNTDRPLHGYTLDAERAEAVYEQIFDMDDDARLSAGIEAGRLDTVLCGQLPVLALMEKLSSPQLVISTAGLREGVLYSLLENI